MTQAPAAATGTVMRSDILRGFARDAGFSDLKFVSGRVWGSLNALAAWELLLTRQPYSATGKAIEPSRAKAVWLVSTRANWTTIGMFDSTTTP
jgi:hypothetical protein